MLRFRCPAGWALAMLAAGCSSVAARESPRAAPVFSPTNVPVTTAASTRPPLRVLLVGDELMARAGTVVKARLERDRRATVAVDVTPGRGLAGVEDWPARVARDLDDFAPAVVVVLFGGVDTAPYATAPDGTSTVPGTGPWYDRWGGAEKAFVSLFARRGVKSYWVGAPPARESALDDRVQIVGLAAEALHREFADTVAHIDTRSLLVGSDGGFGETRLAPDGSILRLRSADGYGLGPDGASLMGEAIADRIAGQWCLDDPPVDCQPAFTSVNPLPASAPRGRRVLLVGDSMMWQLAPVIVTRLEAAGVHALADVRSTTSLVGSFDWQNRLTRLVDTYRPDVVVGLFVGDLPAGFTDPEGNLVVLDSPHYIDLTAQALEEATKRLRARGARMLWVAGPVAASADLEQRLETFSALYDGIAERSVGEVGVIDGFAPLADATGEWTASLPDGDGRPGATRLPDGLHVTTAGAARLADAVIAAVRQDPCVAGTGPCLGPT